jgi:SAM-dependent methyltransferase
MPSVAQNLPDKNSICADKGVDLRICQCKFCGTVQLDNEPVSYYREVIRATGISDEMRLFRISQFSGFINRFGLRGKKIIEIGCGSGENLRVLKECGAEPYGLEYSEKSVLAAKAAGLNVYRGFADSSGYNICGTPFDGFYTFNFLEHLPRPLETLKGVYNNLSGDAYGLVEVPNTEICLSDGVFSDFMLDHLFYFTKDTLNTALQLSGFEVLECDSVWRGYIISATVKKRGVFDLSYMKDLREDMRAQIDAYINSRVARGVAVWGASHQAFFILAILNSAKKLKYVIDSAEFKQGKYTPVSHIPIVAPDKLTSDPVGAVIVMASSYSDEVVGRIKADFGEIPEISVLRPRGLEIIR